MTNSEITELRKAAIAFRISPGPTTADQLLKLLAPHRENHIIQRLIDEVLDFKFQIETFPVAIGRSILDS